MALSVTIDVLDEEKQFISPQNVGELKGDPFTRVNKFKNAGISSNVASKQINKSQGVGKPRYSCNE